MIYCKSAIGAGLLGRTAIGVGLLGRAMTVFDDRFERRLTNENTMFSLLGVSGQPLFLRLNRHFHRELQKKKKNELKKSSQGNWVGEVVEGGSSLERFCWPTVLLFFIKKI